MSKEKIVVIDDSKLMLKAMEGILSSDFDVFAFTDGLKVIDKIKVIKPALILLDIIMPKISGFEIIQQIKADPSINEIPIIFLTGLNDEGNEERGLELGATDYITKPLRPAIVYARVKLQVEAYLNKSKLIKEQEYSNTFLGITDDALFDYDVNQKRMKFSTNFANRFGIPEIMENYPRSFLDAGIVDDDLQECFLEIVHRMEQEGNEKNLEEIQLRLPNRELVWYSIKYILFPDDVNSTPKVIGKMTDITEQKKKMDELTIKAMTDPLTGLLNKEETRCRIENCLLSNQTDEKFALLLIDIDNFKGVNDNLGHQFGDTVLIDIAGKIKNQFRDSDIVGRMGGDEFVVFMRNLKDEDIVATKAALLSRVFRHTFSGPNQDYKISGSIGIAFTSQYGENYQDLYRFADMALYESKRRGKDCFTIFHDSMSKKIPEQTKPVEEAKQFISTFFSDDLAYQIIGMLYETKDFDETINGILQLLGTKFQVSRVLIYEHNDNGISTSNTYYWCAEGIPHNLELLQNISFQELEYVWSMYQPGGIFYCNDIGILNASARRIMEKQGTKSLLRCAFYLNGKMKGCIGFDDCKTERVWRGEEIAMLSYIAKILSVFLMKKRITNAELSNLNNLTRLLMEGETKGEK